MSFQDGITLFKSEDYNAAADHFYQIIKEEKENHKAWNALGTCLSKLEKYEDAKTCFKNALHYQPDNEIYNKNKKTNDLKCSKEEEDLFSLDDEPIIERKININTSNIINNKISHNILQQKNDILTSIQPTNKFWGLFVLSLFLLFIPTSVGTFIFWIFLTFTVYLIYDDAKKIGVGYPNAKESTLRWRPGSWGAGVFLFFIFFLPFYAYKRNKWCSEFQEDLGHLGNDPRSRDLIIISIICSLFFIWQMIIQILEGMIRS